MYRPTMQQALVVAQQQWLEGPLETRLKKQLEEQRGHLQSHTPSSPPMQWVTILVTDVCHFGNDAFHNANSRTLPLLQLDIQTEMCLLPQLAAKSAWEVVHREALTMQRCHTQDAPAIADSAAAFTPICKLVRNGSMGP